MSDQGNLRLLETIRTARQLTKAAAESYAVLQLDIVSLDEYGRPSLRFPFGTIQEPQKHGWEKDIIRD